MNSRRYRLILYFISLVIISTIAIQVYWNYKNYQVNKRQLIREVQISLDRAIDQYYANLAEESTLSIAFESHKPLFDYSRDLDSLVIREDSISLNILDRGEFEFETFQKIGKDSILVAITEEDLDSIRSKRRMMIRDFMATPPDSLADRFRSLTSKVILSLSQDTVQLKDIDSLLKLELDRKNINLDYELEYRTRRPNDSIKRRKHNHYAFRTISSSAFLPNNKPIGINFSNTTTAVLKRISGSLLLSSLLIIGVIACLFYLLIIIRKQKELAEIKNDLIGNITHEFKTPISTIAVALESISDFNALDDKAKTSKYLDMSKEQLGKLTVMVEKLLETATLDSDELELQKEAISLNDLMKELIEKFKISHPGKPIELIHSGEDLSILADRFHLENAINNIIDNAIKYGGETISISVVGNSSGAEVSIFDSGTTLTSSHKDKIFEKFYRVPKGNTHDVKGFGIGLYYSKTIIEKHGGTIGVDLRDNGTNFKITLPYE